jgi:hypothetical protein
MKVFGVSKDLIAEPINLFIAQTQMALRAI